MFRFWQWALEWLTFQGCLLSSDFLFIFVLIVPGFFSTLFFSCFLFVFSWVLWSPYSMMWYACVSHCVAFANTWPMFDTICLTILSPSVRSSSVDNIGRLGINSDDAGQEASDQEPYYIKFSEKNGQSKATKGRGIICKSNPSPSVWTLHLVDLSLLCVRTFTCIFDTDTWACDLKV